MAERRRKKAERLEAQQKLEDKRLLAEQKVARDTLESTQVGVNAFVGQYKSTVESNSVPGSHCSCL